MSKKTATRGDGWALLGLARRAGSVKAGTDVVREALRAGEGRLVIYARDASPAQRRKVEALQVARDVPGMEGPDRVELGRLVGAPPLSALVVTDAALASRIRDLAAQASPDGSGGKSNHRR